jgi:hypothetical protein
MLAARLHAAASVASTGVASPGGDDGATGDIGATGAAG